MIHPATLLLAALCCGAGSELATPAVLEPATSRPTASLADPDCDDGSGLDCNSNGVADSCDIDAGTSVDCSGNGVPDECAPAGPVRIAKLKASDAASYDLLGYRVDISGEVAIVGALGESDAGSLSGSAYIFRNDAGSWQQEFRLSAADAAAQDRFGASVAIDGAGAIVGAPGNDENGTDGGAAYIFRSVDGGWQQVAKITALDVGATREFGSSVALKGDTAVVGTMTPGGAGWAIQGAYVFREIDGSWQQIAKLSPGDETTGSGFGYSVAMDDGVIVVGAPFYDDYYPENGTAYVFQESAGTWRRVTQLTTSYNLENFGWSNFGNSVSIDADSILIGALGAHFPHVSAGYVFRNTSGEWREVCRLTGLAAPSYWYSDFSVDISGDTAILSSGFADAYIFRSTNGRWSQSARISAPGDYFGDVAVDAGIAIVGAPHDDDHARDSGAAYLYVVNGTMADCNANGTSDDCDIHGGTSDDCDANGQPDECAMPATLNDCNGNGVADNCDVAHGTSADCNTNALPDECDAQYSTEQQMLLPGDYLLVGFGESLDATGDSLIVGAPENSDRGVEAGSVYVFQSTDDIERKWRLHSELVMHDAEAGDRFGASMDASGDLAIVGASGDDDHGTDSGAAYILHRSAGAWEEAAKLTASDGVPGHEFGKSVAINTDTAVVGAPADAHAGARSGAAYVFRQIDGTWLQVAKLTAPDAVAQHHFGFSVAIQADTIVIGAMGDSDRATGGGAAYIFREVAGSWHQVAKLYASDAAPSDHFGARVAIAGQTIVVGEWGIWGTQRVYVFREVDDDWVPDGILVLDERTGHLPPSISIDGDYIVTSCPADSPMDRAQVYRRVGGEWRLFTKVLCADTHLAIRFGGAAIIDSGRIFVAGGPGAVYYFDESQLYGDCNQNLRPDRCELEDASRDDCNLNRLLDECDLAFGASADCNDDGQLDECFQPGDVDADGDVDIADHAALAGCLAGPGVELNTGCCLSDTDGDGDADLGDFATLQGQIGMP